MTEHESPAETIRRAAALIGERAEAASCLGMSVSPWRTGEPCDCGCCEAVTDATGSLIAKVDDRQSAHIASWHPLVALAVAEWLDEVADDRHACLDAWVERAALKIARAYLREAS